MTAAMSGMSAQNAKMSAQDIIVTQRGGAPTTLDGMASEGQR